MIAVSETEVDTVTGQVVAKNQSSLVSGLSFLIRLIIVLWIQGSSRHITNPESSRTRRFDGRSGKCECF